MIQARLYVIFCSMRILFALRWLTSGSIATSPTSLCQAETEHADLRRLGSGRGGTLVELDPPREIKCQDLLTEARTWH